jgi:hypothetical protein
VDSLQMQQDQCDAVYTSPAAMVAEIPLVSIIFDGT